MSKDSSIVRHGTPDVPLSIPEIEDREWRRRAQSAQFADTDAMLGAKAVVAAGVMEQLQTEWQNPEKYIHTDTQLSYPFKFFLEDLPKLPLDWKAVAPAAATYVAVNVLARARDYQNYGSELASARLAAAGAQGFVPHTEKSLKRFQRLQRAKRVATTILSMGAAYKVGTELNAASDLVAGTGILGVGLAAHVTKNRRANRAPKVKPARVRRSVNRQRLETEYDPRLNTQNLFES